MPPKKHITPKMTRPTALSTEKRKSTRPAKKRKTAMWSRPGRASTA